VHCEFAGSGSRKPPQTNGPVQLLLKKIRKFRLSHSSNEKDSWTGLGGEGRRSVAAGRTGNSDADGDYGVRNLNVPRIAKESRELYACLHLRRSLGASRASHYTPHRGDAVTGKLVLNEIIFRRYGREYKA
jgi:hypothetical protein